MMTDCHIPAALSIPHGATWNVAEIIEPWQRVHVEQRLLGVQVEMDARDVQAELLFDGSVIARSIRREHLGADEWRFSFGPLRLAAGVYGIRYTWHGQDGLWRVATLSEPVIT